MRLNVQTATGQVKVSISGQERKHLVVAKNILAALSGLPIDEDEKKEAAAGLAGLRAVEKFLAEEPAPELTAVG